MMVLQVLIDHTHWIGRPHDRGFRHSPRQVDSGPLHVTDWGESSTIEISQVALEAILNLRELYRQEMNCQIVHDSLHARHFLDSYLIRVGGRWRATARS